MRVKTFDIFPDDYDASTVTFMRVPISLNMVARPCAPEDPTYIPSDNYVDFRGDEYIDDFIYPIYDTEKEQFYTKNQKNEREYTYQLKDEMTMV